LDTKLARQTTIDFSLRKLLLSRRIILGFKIIKL